MTFRTRLLQAGAIALAAGLALTGCAGGTGPSDDSPSQSPGAQSPGAQSPGAQAADTGTWPRTIQHEAGETTIPQKPEHIVSTALSVTGTLLAIGAPVTASAATSPSSITDSTGFFSQWSDAAKDAGVQVLYPNLEFDLESVVAADPDLIIVSTSGADSVADQYDALSKIAPTIVVNYGNKTWEDLAVDLGEATGHEQGAQDAIDAFDQHVKDTAARLTLPDGTASIVGYNGASSDNGVGKLTGPHAKLLEDLGFTVVEAPDDLDTSERPRQDFAFVSLENLTKAATGDTVFLLSASDDKVDAFLADPVLANLPSVQKKQVYAMGPTSFRLDYYSATELVDLLGGYFS